MPKQLTTDKDAEPQAKPKPNSELFMRVLSNYRGVPSNEQIIPAGIYAKGDAALLGLEDYLLKNGHAVLVDGLGKRVASS